jgi:hypothetical protein
MKNATATSQGRSLWLEADGAGPAAGVSGEAVVRAPVELAAEANGVDVIGAEVPDLSPKLAMKSKRHCTSKPNGSSNSRKATTHLTLFPSCWEGPLSS